MINIPSCDQETTNHFDSIAEVFNRIWYFSDGYKEFVINHIRRDLSLSSEDILADIGGGTGSFTSRLQKESAGIKVYCVEPSLPMCNEAAKLENITALCMDAHTFLSTETPFSKLLFKEVIHHIDERERLWRAVYSRLPHQGKLLIITRPQNIAFPLFASAKAAFARNQPQQILLESELTTCGFEVISSKRTHPFTLPKESWYEMLRHRFMSDLGIFSDEEIEAGIDEIDPLYPNATIDIMDHLIFITATKK